MSSKKCVIWDLDNTLWDGICLYGEVTVKPEVIKTVFELDKRGVLQSIASRGDEETAIKELKRNDLEELFLVPKINWLPKSQNISAIAKELDISLDSIAFIDDDSFERDQVAFMLPEVLTIDADYAGEITSYNEFCIENLTSEASNRRELYKTEVQRKKDGEFFVSREEFLLSCHLKLKVRKANENDITRVLELMTRTHQLNTTGLIISENEIGEIISGGERTIYVAELEDKYGNYGIIGTAITMIQDNGLVLKYLALSCRVMGRGIEQAFLSYLLQTAQANHLTDAVAEFRDTGRNKAMLAFYLMGGFKRTQSYELVKFTRRLDAPFNHPKWIEIL